MQGRGTEERKQEVEVGRDRVRWEWGGRKRGRKTGETKGKQE